MSMLKVKSSPCIRTTNWEV